MAETIRIGAFFDGTGNNMWIDKVLGENSQTNVADLYDLYRKMMPTKFSMKKVLVRRLIQKPGLSKWF